VTQIAEEVAAAADHFQFLYLLFTFRSRGLNKTSPAMGGARTPIL
jgi:hypothetical protein